MKNKILALILMIAAPILALQVSADEVSFRASAPRQAVMDEPFQITYSLNQRGRDFRLPSMGDFEVVGGPFQSESTSMSIINGKTTTTHEITYTYTLMPKKEGTYTLSAATIVIDGKKYSSNALKIQVLPAGQGGGQQATGRRQGSGGQQAVQSNAGSADRLFVKANISKTKVLEQEAILVTYKLYAMDDIVGISSVKKPDFDGFLVQEIDIPQIDLRRDTYNGRNYLSCELYKAVLFPQHAGTIAIDKFQCTLAIRIRTQRQARSFFDSFFDSYQDVEKTISTSKTNIQVEALPKPKPADFSGVVGKLALDTKVSATETQSNKPITVTLKVSGSGNIKMFKTPEIKFPQDFEVYEPKVTNSFNTTSAGQQGTKTIEYLVIPRHKGEFVVPNTSISYYDIATRQYRTLNTGELKFNISQGTGDEQTAAVVQNVKDQEKVAMLAKDIRYLSTARPDIKPEEDYIAGTLLYWLCFVIIIAITTALLFFFRKQAKDNANIALVKNKKANKVARKRLKVADREWRAGNKERFYDEILKALWGYTSDKLSMPIVDLNKENISQCLLGKGVNEQTVAAFLELLNECEFQRYAPIDNEKVAMDETFEKTINLISKLEDSIKR